MPESVRQALDEHQLMEAYRRRPPYQRNDYIGWITSARRKETREKRLAQMLDELAGGDRYMKMAYRPRRTTTAPSRQRTRRPNTTKLKT
jgi:hypothetical protein